MSADRILSWYVDTLQGDNLSIGPVHIADRDYRPHVARVYAKTPPGAGDMTFDIKDDGVSIFGSVLPRLRKGQNAEDVAEDFLGDAATIARYSLLTLDLPVNATSGVTVQLELVAEQDDEVADSDT